MRHLAILVTVLLVPTALAGGWIALNRYVPPSGGSAAHAGIVSQGRPEQCTDVNANVPPRATKKHVVPMQEDDLVRGTVTAQGGVGHVDIVLTVLSPNDETLVASNKAENYDFTFPAKYPGNYTFVFDNRYSLYTSKRVALYYCIDRGT